MADGNTNNFQMASMANLIVATRLPQEFRRDAILGAMIGQINPMAGVVLAVRNADAITALVQERDAAKAAADAAAAKAAAGAAPAAAAAPAAPAAAPAAAAPAAAA